tara:strand:+ start:1756 stop:2940 length:1185 start_codon:yes stop_codon:yes gene_type:complete
MLRRPGESISARDLRAIQAERRAKARRAKLKKIGKKVTKGRIDVPKTAKKVVKATKKVVKKVGKKVGKSTAARLASVALKSAKAPLGKFGPLAAAVTLAYYAGEEFFPNKAKSKTTTTKKPTAKSVPSSFGSAFKKAYKDNPGGNFTYKGKKYKAVMKKPRKEDKGVSQSDIMGGTGRMAGGMMKKYNHGGAVKPFRRKYLGETNEKYNERKQKHIAYYTKQNEKSKKKDNSKFDDIGLSEFGKTYLLDKKRKLSPGEDKIRKSDMMGGTPLGMSVDEKKKAKKKYDPTKANRAGQRMGQRKAGGMMKKMAGGAVKKYNEGGLKDVPTNKQKSLGQLPTKVRNKMGFKMSGGMAKKKMMGGGMMKYKNGTGKKGVAVQARGCGAVLSKTKTRVT